MTKYDLHVYCHGFIKKQNTEEMFFLLVILLEGVIFKRKTMNKKIALFTILIKIKALLLLNFISPANILNHEI